MVSKQQTPTGVTAGASSTTASLKSATQVQEVYGDVPLPRFGHSITLVSKTKVVLFGGATGDTGRYSMTGDTFIFNVLTRTWIKLEGKYQLIYE